MPSASSRFPSRGKTRKSGTVGNFLTLGDDLNLWRPGYGLADWSQPVQLVTPFMLVLLAIGMAAQFTPRDLLVRLDHLYHRLPTWGVGVLGGGALLVIELVGGDSTAPFIYFQF